MFLYPELGERSLKRKMKYLQPLCQGYISNNSEHFAEENTNGNYIR
ncbi:hypothetical protein IQ229_21025 [Nostoc cf. edaphicum LEGE 07299]|uniref:Transposase n=1 Tax=Nostoc cf. edaphicum LEGE 07299 TaxID=2777974 RepID=A0ABR9U3T0_9NOSO|nr:hypothetical protein [Nostoc edaphicum]MBE9107320.1 hypothetical protein [Nostoc cf. edaphicum LEGE 07299]